MKKAKLFAQRKHSLFTLIFALLSSVGAQEQQKYESERPLYIPVKEESPDESDDFSNSPHKISSAVTFLSDYRSREISQTAGRPAVQGEIKYRHASGCYFKSWASNVDGTGNFLNNTSLEWALSLGLKNRFHKTSDWSYDTGILFYYYPGGKSRNRKNISFDTFEYYVEISYKNLSIKLSQTLNDYFGINSDNPPINWKTLQFFDPNGHSYGSPYLEANYEWSFWKNWKGTIHIGYQDVINYHALSYIDWEFGLSYQFPWFEAFLYYIDTNAKKDFYDVPDNAYKPRRIALGAATVVAGITHKF